MTPGDQGDQSPLVVDLARLGARDLNRGGGKAANLGELLARRIPGSARVRDHYDRLRPRGEEQ